MVFRARRRCWCLFSIRKCVQCCGTSRQVSSLDTSTGVTRRKKTTGFFFFVFLHLSSAVFHFNSIARRISLLLALVYHEIELMKMPKNTGIRKTKIQLVYGFVGTDSNTHKRGNANNTANAGVFFLFRNRTCSWASMSRKSSRWVHSVL